MFNPYVIIKKQFATPMAYVCFIMLFSACIEKERALPNYVINANEALHMMQQSNNWRLFEISKPTQYVKGHIAEAFNLWRPDYATKEPQNITGMRATKFELEQLLSNYGVDDKTILILYDVKGNCDAARFAWQLELWGFNNFRLISGGKKNWQLQGFELTKTMPSLPPFKVFKFDENIEEAALLATYQDVYEALADTNTLIVDTRELYEFKGLPFEKDGQIFPYKKGAFTNGAIPQAVHYNWSKAVHLKGNHQLKNIQDLAYDLAAVSIFKEKNIILYCQSGTRSAHTSFVLRHILKYPNVKNYDGSWIEWSYLNTTCLKDAPIDQPEIK